MPRSQTRRPAFTLIELLVVISIIAVLIAIITPALGSAREQGVLVRELSRARDNGTAYLMFATDHHDYVLMSHTDTSKAIPRPLRKAPTDLRGQPLTGLTARNWFWRLAPYLEDNLTAFYRDEEPLETLGHSDLSGPTQDYYLHTWYPAFGINHVFVGGKPQYYPSLGESSPTRDALAFGDDFWVRSTAMCQRPSTLMAMVSSAKYEAAEDRIIEGYYQATAPAYSAINSEGEWINAPEPDPFDEPGLTGHVRLVAADKGVGVMLDGHAEAFSWEQLSSDMRLWAPSASTPDWRLPLLAR